MIRKGFHKFLVSLNYGTILAHMIRTQFPISTACPGLPQLMWYGLTLTPAGNYNRFPSSKLKWRMRKKWTGLNIKPISCACTMVTLPKVGGKRTSQPHCLQACYRSLLCLTLHKDSSDFLIASSESWDKGKMWDNPKQYTTTTHSVMLRDNCFCYWDFRRE